MATREMIAERPTTYSIAKQAGVSQSAVSQVLNNRGKYSEKTRLKVLTVAQEMGYHTISIRKAIKKPLKQLGFVVPAIDLSKRFYFSEIFSAVSKSATQQEYTLSVCQIPFDLEKESERVKWFGRLSELASSGLIDGILIDKSYFAEDYLVKLEQMNLPFVFINGRLPHNDNPIEMKALWCCINHRQGVEKAAELLVQLGHKNIALFYFLEPSTTYRPYLYDTSQMAFIEILKKKGIEIKAENMMRGEIGNPALIFSGIDILLARKEIPTAIFIPDDPMAIVAINHIRSRGYRVPQDISVMGYGGFASCQPYMPELTTIKAPWSDMGEYGIKMLIDACNGKEVDNPKIFSTEIQYGQTICPARRTV